MRRLFMCAALVTLAMLSAGVGVSPAGAATGYPPWEEGFTDHPFSLLQPVPPGVAVLGTADQRLELAHVTLARLGPTAAMWADYPSGERPDPRMAYPLENGHVLVSGGKDVPYVKEVDAAGNVVWEYRNGPDGLLRKPFSAEPATFRGRPCVLISDRIACRVFAVSWDNAKEVVWQYGTTDGPGAGVNQLADPFCATQIPATEGQTSGNVLIADSNDNHRVVEIRADDYLPAASDLGYSAASVVWQYGVTGQSGSTPGYLNQARSPQRLANGDTLITDAVGKRIIEVRSSDYDPARPDNGYTAASIVWSYVDGVEGELRDPNTARAVESGSLAGTIVFTDCDGASQRVRIVDKTTKAIVDTFDLSAYDRPAYAGPTDAASPRDARVAADGSLWIADAAFGQILRLGNGGSGTVTSASLSCGKPGLLKAFVRMKIEAPAQASGTSFEVWYSVDGGDGFQRARISRDGRNVNFPAGTTGRRFAYRMVLTSTDRWATPVFEGMAIHFSKATIGGGGGGGGGDGPGGSGNSGQSGSYTYPSTAQGGTGTSGTGTGSGTYGSGTGSGSAGTGTGASSTAGSGGSSAVANSVEIPVESTGSGTLENVQGYQVQGEEGVSGVPLRAVEGAQAAEPERPGPAVPMLALVAAGLLVAAAFFIPWPFVAAHLRSLTGFDHTRPARSLPFRPLGK
jgi:hypothetical protein